MKTLTFNFSHPFKGQAIIKMIGSANALCKRLWLDSKDSNIIEIPLNNFQSGNYELTLYWEVNQHSYTHQQTFEIKGKPDLILATT